MSGFGFLVPVGGLPRRSKPRTFKVVNATTGRAYSLARRSDRPTISLGVVFTSSCRVGFRVQGMVGPFKNHFKTILKFENVNGF